MSKFFLGKDLKKINNYAVVIGQHANTVYVATSGKAQDDPRTTIEADVPSLLIEGKSIVLFFANEYSHEWNFFVQALKPTDQVTFFTRENGTQTTRARGIRVRELVASITRVNFDRGFDTSQRLVCAATY
jgi:hypothetical protein